MKMLDELRDVLDDIEKRSEWDHRFVEGLLIQEDEGRDFSEKPVTGKQFNILNRIYNRYVMGW